MNMDEQTLNQLSHQVIGCALTVASTLGTGFSEKVYENSLVHELRKAGFAVAQQRGSMSGMMALLPGTIRSTCWSTTLCWWSSRWSRRWMMVIARNA